MYHSFRICGFSHLTRSHWMIHGQADLKTQVNYLLNIRNDFLNSQIFRKRLLTCDK